MNQWERAQEGERSWWGNCVNTYQEETKQREMFAPRLGLKDINHEGRWPSYDIGGRSVADIGGGPVSILLKCFNYNWACVIDPCHYPEWVAHRYDAAKIVLLRRTAEDIPKITVDEVWIYNVLQHVIDPKQVIESAKKCCDLIRIVEFIEVKTDDKHLHSLSANTLDRWLGGLGVVEYIPEFNAHVYYGSFKT